MSENITVLKEESLGGVMREYREVKRKAAVGELIKIVSAKDRRCPIGAIGTCTRNDEFADGSIDTTLSFEGSEKDGFINTEHAEYVVLEPTDILVVDGARYRMVDREATVGERVIVVAADDPNEDGYGNGAVFTVYAKWSGGVVVDHDIALYNKEYHVLEPVETATTPQLSELPASDQIAENIAALAARVSGLEAEVAELGETLQAVIEAANPAKLSISTADVKSLVDAATKNNAAARKEVAA